MANMVIAIQRSSKFSIERKRFSNCTATSSANANAEQSQNASQTSIIGKLYKHDNAAGGRNLSDNK